jgi:tetratricopeptide (TPR) repeat protein
MRRTLLLVPLLVVAFAADAAAQELRLRRDVPAVAWAGCPADSAAAAPRAVPADRRQEAERLASAATQSAILGDNTAAADLLAAAAQLDPSSASIAYRHARALDDLGRAADAIAEYCRFLALAPDAPDAPDVRERTSALSESGGMAVPAAAVEAWEAAIESYGRGRLHDAERGFGEAIAAAPAWSDPVYNRGVVRIELGRAADAVEDLRRFLEMSPGAPEFDAVLDRIATLRVGARYNPDAVLAAGLIVPGLGHFRTGRAGTGLAVLGSATLAVVAGAAVRSVSVECLSPPVDGVCPPGDVVGEDVSRPWLVPGIAAAAVIGVIGALDARRGARRLNAAAAAGRGAALDVHWGGAGSVGIALAPPGIYTGRNRAHVELLRIRF